MPKASKILAAPPRGSSDPDSEEAFLARYDPSIFDRPSVAVDVVVLTAMRGSLRVALYLRTEHPSRGRYALPGGFVRIDESLDDAAARLLRDKVGLTGVFIEQLHTFGAPGRDPRCRIITVAYYALVDPRRFDGISAGATRRAAAIRGPRSGSDGDPVEVVGEEGEALPLAFDHADIIGAAVRRLRGKLDATPLGFELLPPSFTLRALQDVHEAVRGAPLNKDSFRRRMLAGGLLEATGELEQGKTHRPAELYRFTRDPGDA